MFEKVFMIAAFFAVTASIGIYCRRHATNVNDFVLGGRNMGPWMSAFATPVNSDGILDCRSPGSVSEMQL